LSCTLKRQRVYLARLAWHDLAVQLFQNFPADYGFVEIMALKRSFDWTDYAVFFVIISFLAAAAYETVLLMGL
jgi:hypothetical protein